MIVHQRHDARIVAAIGDRKRGAFRAAVINDDDQVDLGTDGRDDRQDGGRRAIRWNDDAVHGSVRGPWSEKCPESGRTDGP